MRVLVLTCLVLLFLESNSFAAEKPNMLFLLSDDHLYGSNKSGQAMAKVFDQNNLKTFKD